jgi:hypothetical protein
MDKLIQFFSDNSTALIVSVIANAISGLAAWYIKHKFKSRKFSLPLMIGVAILLGATALYFIISILKAPRKADVMFSDFDNCFAINHYKVHWGVLNDNPFNGNSNLTIEIHPTPEPKTSNDCYAVLSFYLGENSTIRPYCGAFTWFAPKPIETRDITAYNGIRLEAWHDKDLDPAVRVYLQISPYQFIESYNGYLECDITSDLKKNAHRAEISLPFSKFIAPPDGPDPSASLSKEFQKSVYQLSIVVQGEKGRAAQGKICFDNLKFYN